MNPIGINYTPSGQTIVDFLRSDALVRALTGPFGSGKTVACVIEIYRRAREQAPGSDGVRRTRWMVVRETYPRLKTTTIKSWRDWWGIFPGFSWGPPPVHHLVLPLNDGTVMDCEVIFVALDGPDAEDALTGAELTGIFFNEVRDITWAVVQTGLGRVGRYPSKRDVGPTWHGAIMDTNPPATDHWLYKLAEEEKPDGWAFFRQPGGVVKVDGIWQANPAAENLANLPEGYYTSLVAGADEDWIRVFLGGEYGFVIEGKPVYPEFRDSAHVAAEAFPPIEGLPIGIGFDFGLTPAAVFGQRTARGQWRIFDELVADDMGVVRFAELLEARLAEWYQGFDFETAWGDPAGNQRVQTDEQTCIDILNQKTRLTVMAAPSNDWTLRREAVAAPLSRMVDGMPGFVLSPACTMLRRGFAGGYHYNRVRVVGDERFHDKPDKNAYSHPQEGLQYLMLGSGEGDAVLGRKKAQTARLPTRSNSGGYSPTRHWRRAS